MSLLKISPFLSSSVAYAILHDEQSITFARYTTDKPMADLACALRDCLRGKQRVAWWVPEWMRLRQKTSRHVGSAWSSYAATSSNWQCTCQKKSRKSQIYGSMTSTRRRSDFKPDGR